MRVIFTILFFIFLISYIFRLLTPYIMRWAMRRMEKKITEQFNNMNNTANQKRTKREGQVSINQTEKREKKVDKNVGDYVDFEEQKNKTSNI